MRRLGATEEAWRWFAHTLGLAEHLLPACADPMAPIASGSTLQSAMIGKVPSRYNQRGEIVGFAEWSTAVITPMNIRYWMHGEYYNCCCRGNGVQAFDFDTEDEDLILAMMGRLPAGKQWAVRRREGSRRVLLPFICHTGLRKRVIRLEEKKERLELLATGQHWVAAGTHPSGRRYWWEHGVVGPYSIPVLTVEQVEEVWEAWKGYGVAIESVKSAGGGGGGGDGGGEGRNVELRNRAYSLRKAGAGADELTEKLKEENAKLSEPLAKEEVSGIVAGTLRRVEADPVSADEFEVVKPASRPAEKPRNGGIPLRPLEDVMEEKYESRWLPGLTDVLEKGVLALLVGPRSTYKSFIALHWALSTAAEGAPVVLLSAEGRGLGRRAEAWCKTYREGRKMSVHVLEQAIALNLPKVLKELQAAIDALPARPQLIVVDTSSKYSPGLEESDNAAVAVFLTQLSRALREYYDCTVLLVAHTGHTEQGRMRGAYSYGANTDAEYIVMRPTPTSMEVSVSRERFKDSLPLPALGYDMEVVELDRKDVHGRTVTSLIAREGEAPEKPVARTPHKNARAQLALLAELRKSPAGRVWTLKELRATARSLGQSKQTAYSAVDGLVQSGYLIEEGMGGFTLSERSEV